MCRIFVVSNAFLTRTFFFEGCPVGLGGVTHRSWPGGRGGRPRALVAGEVGGDGSSRRGRVGAWSKEERFLPCGVAGGYPPELAWWTGG